MWNPIRVVVQRLGERDPLLLAHHPTCEYYSHHTFELYGQRVCMGCFIVYPVAILSLLALSVVRLVRPALGLFEFPTSAFYLAGFGLVAPMVVGKLLPGTRTATTRIASKALLAVGLAVTAFPFVFRPDARLVTAGLFVAFLLPYIVHKGLTATDDCQGCPEAADFPNCSGMSFDGEYRYQPDDTEE
ncbi:hypothetical protein [Halopiger djelfimassiliensis]|uniref:hypothetical protein n=1 Tax=Halopiger djelfimassiliensis TaxID=1293047 RepID=UPI000677B13C|nr:hypothetical protein [Halopiger djelfimassiliensis]